MKTLDGKPVTNAHEWRSSSGQALQNTHLKWHVTRQNMQLLATSVLGYSSKKKQTKKLGITLKKFP